MHKYRYELIFKLQKISLREKADNKLMVYHIAGYIHGKPIFAFFVRRKELMKISFSERFN